MLFQTLYFLVDLYFVAGLGGAAIAGVGSAGNASFLILALTQVLGIGSVALIAQAVRMVPAQETKPSHSLLAEESCGDLHISARNKTAPKAIATALIALPSAASMFHCSTPIGS